MGVPLVGGTSVVYEGMDYPCIDFSFNLAKTAWNVNAFLQSDSVQQVDIHPSPVYLLKGGGPPFEPSAGVAVRSTRFLRFLHSICHRICVTAFCGIPSVLRWTL
jgi:hypothetical protein